MDGRFELGEWVRLKPGYGPSRKPMQVWAKSLTASGYEIEARAGSRKISAPGHHFEPCAPPRPHEVREVYINDERQPVPGVHENIARYLRDEATDAPNPDRRHPQMLDEFGHPIGPADLCVKCGGPVEPFPLRPDPGISESEWLPPGVTLGQLKHGGDK